MITTNFPAEAFDFSNPEPRLACVLLLDTSSSMDGAPIQALNAGLVAFHEALNIDDLARLRVEIAVITFGGSPIIVQDFVTADQFNPPNLTAGGGTPMGAAINLALDQIEQRKSVHRRNRVPFYRPWVFLITDGEATHDDEWQRAVQRVQAAEAVNKIAFIATFIGEGKALELLGKLGLRKPLPLHELDFRMLVKFGPPVIASPMLSADLPLPAPTGWATI